MALYLRKVIHPQAHDNYRVILKREGDEVEIGSIGNPARCRVGLGNRYRHPDARSGDARRRQGPQGLHAAVQGRVGPLCRRLPPKMLSAMGNALLDGFRNNGLIPERDLIFETRFTEGDDERSPELARKLARLKARAILANTPAGVRAAQ